MLKKVFFSSMIILLCHWSCDIFWSESYQISHIDSVSFQIRHSAKQDYQYPIKISVPTPFMYDENIYFSYFDHSDSSLTVLDGRKDSPYSVLKLGKSSGNSIFSDDDQSMYIFPFTPDSLLFITYKKILLIHYNEIIKDIDRKSIMGDFYFVRNSYPETFHDTLDNKLLLMFGGDFYNPSKGHYFDYRLFSFLDLTDFKTFLLPTKNPNFDKNYSKVDFLTTSILNNKIYIKYGFDTTLYYLDEKFQLVEEDMYKSQLNKLRVQESNAIKDANISVNPDSTKQMKSKSKTIISDLFPLINSTDIAQVRFIQLNTPNSTPSINTYVDIFDKEFNLIQTINIPQNYKVNYPAYYAEKIIYFPALKSNYDGIFKFYTMELKRK